MLYKYDYSHRHKVRFLHLHFLYFIRKLEGIKRTDKYDVDSLFHHDFRAVLRKSKKLNEKFEKFYKKFKSKKNSDRESIIEKIIDAQSLYKVFEDKSVNPISLRGEEIQNILGNNSFQSLMDYLYKPTISNVTWGIRDHYNEFYVNLPEHKCCPFCGLVSFDSIYKADYDHLLPKSKYPQLAINMRNLAPMCNTCNQKVKKSKDILVQSGVRRKFVYPYKTKLDIEFDFSSSSLPGSKKIQWELDYKPKTEVNKNWMEVFDIRKRYLDNLLDKKYKLWMDGFVSNCVVHGIDISTQAKLKLVMKNESKKYYDNIFLNQNIVKAPLFKQLAESNNLPFYNTVIAMFEAKKKKFKAA